MTRGVPQSRVRARDLARAAVSGALGRRMRAALSILGIALGVAALVTIVGISNSNRAHLNAQLRALGPDLLTVQPGSTFDGRKVSLPTTAPALIRRIGPVRRVAGIGLAQGTVRRTSRVPSGETNAIDVVAATDNLRSALGVALASGRWLVPGPAPLPEVVLGATAAQRLGLTTVGPESRVFIAGQYYAVIGILVRAPLAPEIDSSALVTQAAAVQGLGFDRHLTTIYVRSDESAVGDVRDVLAATANPAAAETVSISRPSDVLEAKAATDTALNTLIIVLAGIALLVGGIGVANTMIVAVLERRQEIGLRRALGGTRAHITAQFLSEATILAIAGGVVGALLGVGAAVAVAGSRGWPIAPPWAALGASLGSTIVIGVVAGLYPAIKAAHQQPTAALTGAT
ncbi:MAG TPA: ABC transporter permease [Acidimicrobiales bacterium]